jgi:single-stranded DNA-binding protein
MTLHGYCTPDGRPDTMDGKWMTYGEAAVRLGVSPEAARRRAIRGNWARMPGNDGRTRVQVPDELHPPRTPDVRGTELELVSALKSHIDTLKADIERLTAELAGERSAHQDQLAAERTRADGATAELKGDITRLEGDLAVERVTRRADQKQHQDQLAAERAARQAELAGERVAHQAELAAERTARQADYEQHQDQLAAERAGRQADQECAAARQANQDQQLAAARAAADRGTAELVELARRLAEIAEKQAAAEAAEAEPEPPRRSAAGRAWRWFLRN